MRPAILVVALVAWGAVSMPASAQRAADEAQREYRLGYKALQAGNCAEALVHYRRSFELTPRPRTMFNMAACEEELGLSADAWRSYHAFLDLAEARDAEIVIKAKARIAALRGALRGKVTVESSPPGASVLVDGEREARGVTPLTLALEPGTHTIRLTMSNAAPTERTVEVNPDEVETLAVTLATSSAITVADPRAPSIDGGEADLGDPVPRRRERVRLPPPSSIATTRAARSPGEVVTVDLDAPRVSRGRRALGWGLGGLGVVGIAGGSVVGVLALRDVASPLPDEHDRGKRRALVADGLFVVSAVAVVAAWRLLRGRSPSVAITRTHEGTR